MMGATIPTGRNCGACGQDNCDAFADSVKAGERRIEECPFSSTWNNSINVAPQSYGDTDILGIPFDFVIEPLPGEVSARKIILPFRPDMVERMEIRPGDILTGRPMGAGCPVQHVLRVIAVSMVSGVITSHVVGPAYSRGKDVKDLEAYHMLGFEGIATGIRSEPVCGRRMRFLPGFCMMNLGHTGVVNMILGTEHGLHVRVEDVRIL